MFKANELKAELIRKNFSMQDLARALEINIASLYRKMNGSSDFSRKEITATKNFLRLSNTKLIRIFFS